MINFLHAFQPQAILISFGPINIHWYGLIMVVAIIVGLAVTLILAKYYQLDRNLILDLAFWLIIGGIVGARLYDDLLELPYYLQHPLDSIKIWQGGLAIHGAIFAGLLILWRFTKKYKINLWLLGSIITPGLALGQAIGRFGNYFNQELFGLPTNLPWGIPIDLANRPVDYLAFNYFQPTFIYESFGTALIFLILISFHLFFIKKSNRSGSLSLANSRLIVYVYFLLYSLLRFSLEFIRIDYAPTFYGLRAPQIISLIIIFSILILIFINQKPAKPSLEK